MREIRNEGHSGGYLEEAHKPGNAHRRHLRAFLDRDLLRVICLDVLEYLGEAAQSILPVKIF